MRHRLSTLTLATALVFAAASSLAAEQTRSLRQSFPVSASETLRLANLAGTIQLEAGGGGEVVVEATLHAEGRDAAETRRLLDSLAWVEGRDRKGRKEWALSYPVNEYRAFHYPRPEPGQVERETGREAGFWERLLRSFDRGGTTNTEYLGERVTITGRKDDSAPTLYADLKITVPAGGDLAVRNSVGLIHGRYLQGNLEVATGSGHVSLESFSGKLSAATGSGDIHLDDLSGEATLATGSGDVGLKQLSAEFVKAATGSGDVRAEGGRVAEFQLGTGSGDVEVRGIEVARFKAGTGSGDVLLASSLAGAETVKIGTGSGDITILAGADASFDLTAKQGSGDLAVGYGDAQLRKSGKKVVGAVRGGGRTQISVGTGSGDCEIRPGR